MLKLIRSHYIRKITMNRRVGQISILIIMSLIPLFTLLAFVVNLGMLVNAKIALQNAADLAAIAGAATQARQMTSISHMNYEMRETYKRFLAKFYGVGNYMLACYPRSGTVPATSGSNSLACPNGGMGLGNAELFDFINPGVANFPGVPAVCLSENAESNPCQIGDAIKVVVKPNCLPGNPVCSALQAAADSIGTIQNNVCKSNKYLNYEAASKWLYGGEIENKLTLATNNTLDGVATGLGLVPEQIMNYYRIKTLLSYVNEPAKDMDRKRFSAYEDQALDLAASERTILAYKTALGNLNKNVFNDWDHVSMKELIPDNMLMLETVKADVDLPVVLFGSDEVSSTPKDCNLDLYKVSGQPYAGVYKKPGTMDVYYAIRLQAKAKLLFNPFPLKGQADPEGVEIVAYSAAKPFGSRIGPEVTPADFSYSKTVTLSSKDANNQPVQVTYKFNIPYLLIKEDTKPVRYDSVGVLGSMGRIIDFANIVNLPNPASNGMVYTTNSKYTTAPMSKLAHLIMSMSFPDEYELGRYNIPVDTERDTYEKTRKTGAPKSGMVSYYADRTRPWYNLWAPIVSPSAGTTINELSEVFKNEIQQGYSYSQTTTGGFGGAAATLSQEFMDKLTQYLSQLRDMNNSRIAHIVDPQSRYAFKDSGLKPENVLGKVNDIENMAYMATSYTTPNDSDYYAAGRDGYSVKLIPFSVVSKITGGSIPGANSADVSAIHH